MLLAMECTTAQASLSKAFSLWTSSWKGAELLCSNGKAGAYRGVDPSHAPTSLASPIIDLLASTYLPPLLWTFSLLPIPAQPHGGCYSNSVTLLFLLLLSFTQNENLLLMP